MCDESFSLGKRQTEPFKIKVVVSGEVPKRWGEVHALLQILDEVFRQTGERVTAEQLKSAGVYTVKWDATYHHYVHDVQAPAGINIPVVNREVGPWEPTPRKQPASRRQPWWRAKDSIPMDRVPTGQSLTIALLPSLSLEQWRANDWPDRPHP